MKTPMEIRMGSRRCVCCTAYRPRPRSPGATTMSAMTGMVTAAMAQPSWSPSASIHAPPQPVYHVRRVIYAPAPY